MVSDKEVNFEKEFNELKTRYETVSSKWKETKEYLAQIKKATQDIKTVQDLEELYYKNFTGRSDEPPGKTSGLYAPIYGAKAWAQLNLFPIAQNLPKEIWKYSDFRVVAHSSTKVQFAKLHVAPSNFVHTFCANRALPDSEETQLATLREQFSGHHAEMLNRQLWDGVGSESAPFSLNQLISSRSEVEQCKYETGRKLYPTIYGTDEIFVDRVKQTAWSSEPGAVGWADSLVYHNAGTPRSVVGTNLLQEGYLQMLSRGGLPNLILTVDELKSYVESFVKEIHENPTVVSVGQAKDNYTPLIFMLDTNYITLQISCPTQYFEAIDETPKIGMYRTQLNLIVRFFSPQVKIRDIRV